MTRSGIMDFVSGQVVAKAVKRKCEKYQDLCATKGYEFLLFSFSTLGELDADVVLLVIESDVLLWLKMLERVLLLRFFLGLVLLLLREWEHNLFIVCPLFCVNIHCF
ncbi:hypothetical protein OROGR_015465 [Orobanche gracilis]